MTLAIAGTAWLVPASARADDNARHAPVGAAGVRPDSPSPSQDPTADWPVHFDAPPPRPPPTATLSRGARAAGAGESRSYVKAMAMCDVIAVGAPLVLIGVFLAGQGVLYLYAKVDTTFPAELPLVLGAVGVSAAGYVTCGPATHIAHGHVDRAALSLLARPGLPAAAIGLTYLLANSASGARGPGDRFGPSGAEAAVGLVGAAAIMGAFVGAVVFDYGLAARPTVTPAVSPVSGGITAGLSARW